VNGIGDSISGALAWHSEIEMTVGERDEFLSGRWVVRVATNGRNGFPHISPFYYYWDGQRLYLSLTQTRGTYRNLVHDQRCSAMIDMDVRPLTGPRTNYAKAVFIEGAAAFTPIDSDEGVVIAGPHVGSHRAEAVIGLIVARYGLWARDGALGLTNESIGEFMRSPQYADSQPARDNRGRVLVAITPTRIRTWDFSKAPFRLPTAPDPDT
jgi:Pyridoxamine 5'-phosphate oxidase